MFTVLIYAGVYSIAYSSQVYISLATLTTGVILVCATNLEFQLLGFLCSLGSTFVFVMYILINTSQNIVCKQLFNTSASLSSPIKMDKLNLLFYPSSIAFVLMLPFWLFTDGLPLLTLSAQIPTYHICFLFFLNGASHFAQNVLAFTILSLVPPVTYSIASLVKRIFVITASIIYFGDNVSIIQGMGISITFFGLFLYNGAKRDVASKERLVVEILERRGSGALPFTNRPMH